MNEQDISLLSAYLDGQLDGEQSAELENRLQHEPLLKRHLDELRGTDTQLKAAFGDIADEPIPEELKLLLEQGTSYSTESSSSTEPSSKTEPSYTTEPSQTKGSVTASSKGASVVELRPKSNRASGRKLQQSSWFSMALAASIALAVGISINLNQPAMDNPLLSQTLQPSASLAQVLNSSPSGTVNPIEQDLAFSVRPELSFIDNAGDFCRQYRIQGNDQAFRGVACKTDQQWHNVLLVPASDPLADTSSYQPASAYGDPMINQYLDQNMDGIALGKTEETQHLDDSGY